MMEQNNAPNNDPDGAKLKAWLLNNREATKADIKTEVVQMFVWQLKDWFFRLCVGLIGAVVGAGAGAMTFAFLGFNWMLGLIPGAALLGFLTFAFAIGPFRR